MKKHVTIMLIMAFMFNTSFAYNDADVKIESVKKENEILKQEVDFLRQYFVINKLGIPKKTGQYKVVEHPFFGYKLGCSLGFISEKCPGLVKAETLYGDKIQFYNIALPNTGSLSAMSFGMYEKKDQLAIFTVSLSNPNSSLYNQIVNEIESKYKIIEEKRSDNEQEKVEFVTNTDGQQVTIIIQYKPSENYLTIQYAYDSIIMEAILIDKLESLQTINENI